MSEEQVVKTACHVAGVEISPPNGGNRYLKGLYVKIEPNGQNIAFAFSTESKLDRFIRNVADAKVFKCPINFVNDAAIHDTGCEWFAIDAESPDDEVLWRLSAEGFLKAKTDLQEARLKGEPCKHCIDVLCAKYACKP